MTQQKTPTLTPTEAITAFYGSVHEINKQSFPFACKVCGGKAIPIEDLLIKKMAEKPVLSITDCLTHIRKVHKERIKK